MQLSEKSSPGFDDSFVFHPSELHEGKRGTLSPLENCNDQISNDYKYFLGGLG